MALRSAFLPLSVLALIIIPSAPAANIGIRRGKPPTAVLNRRQEASSSPQYTGVVSFEKYPDLYCASDCLLTDYIPCETTTVPCESDSSQDCTVVEKSCYCNDATVMICAWWWCDWFNWFIVEDWYSDVCPEVPKVNFDGLPHCARECMIDEMSSNGCVSYTRNCLCLAGSLFGCPEKCSSEADKQQVLSWYGQQCLLDAETLSEFSSVLVGTATFDLSTSLPPPTGTGGNSPSGTEESRVTNTEAGPGGYKDSGRKLKWYEIYGLTIVLITIVFVSTVYFFIWKAEFKTYRKDRVKRKARLAASMEKLPAVTVETSEKK
ncbi:hypothetical protein ABW19_dt0203398 [Dactylella cylindrospora]|nr:hypothetical protein ABW19_dt0203398 [Dactylella cylindrospora]